MKKTVLYFFITDFAITLNFITKVCDANNKITYYEYDSFNRLRLIKDQDKNIIKMLDYTYKEQQ